MSIKKGLTLGEAFKALNGRALVKESASEELFFDIKKINVKIVDIIKEEMDGLILKGSTSLSAETADPGLDKIKYAGRSINHLTNSWEYSYILFSKSNWFKQDETFDKRFNIIKERITKVLKEAGIVDFSFSTSNKYYGDRTDLKFSAYYVLLVISMPLSTAKINKEREEFIAIQKDLVNDPLTFEADDKLSFKEYCTYFDKAIVRDHKDWIEELYDDYLTLIG